MFAVNSKGETVSVENPIHIVDAERRLERMKVFGALLKKNFKENVAFTYAFQPLYTSDMIIFACRTLFPSASKIVRESLEIEKHLTDKLEKLDIMRSLFQCKENGSMRWYYLTLGAYVIERNLYDGEPIHIKYIQPTSYFTFQRDFKTKLITAEELEKGGVCKNYSVLEGTDLSDTASLLSHSFLRDMDNSQSEKDFKMYRFSLAWEQQKINPDGKFSNVATVCFMNTQIKRRDCYRNYQEVKNMIVKAFKRSYGISYKNNTVSAVLNDGRRIKIYIYGTSEAPQYLFSGKMTSDLDSLRELIENRADEHESKWFTENVKPYL